MTGNKQDRDVRKLYNSQATTSGNFDKLPTQKRESPSASTDLRTCTTEVQKAKVSTKEHLYSATTVTDLKEAIVSDIYTTLGHK
ncbi:hypothetical protein KY285_008445 [Solanum tuberosum]|nr:hypothetical protein KY285_008445 [Solanum tuberosum]